jgi:hypothetical protein
MRFLSEPTPWAMVFRACATPIAHGVGSYKIAIPYPFF